MRIRLETFTVHNCLIAFIDAYQQPVWKGTAQQLWAELHPYAVQWRHGQFPVSERALAVELKKVSALVDLSITYTKEGKQRTRCISIEKWQPAGCKPLFRILS